MTKDLSRAYYQLFEFDPNMFFDASKITTYHYTPEHADAYWKRQLDLNREHLAIMLDDRGIGDIVLKNFDRLKCCCTMGIHLVNDSVKDKGYGTKAEILALQHAFDELGVGTVFATHLLRIREVNMSCRKLDSRRHMQMRHLYIIGAIKPHGKSGKGTL